MNKSRVMVVVAVCFALFGVLSWFWAFMLSTKLDLSRAMRFGWTRVGDRLAEQFSIANPAMVPALWIEVKDRSTLADYHVDVGVGVGSRDEITWNTEAVCRHRGVYTIGPTDIVTGDPFGIFGVRVSFPGTTSIIILPPIIPLEAYTIQQRGYTGEGENESLIKETEVSSSTVREYAMCDNPRWIHWPTSIRHNKLFVRSFDRTSGSHWWVILDIHEKDMLGSGENSTLEHSVLLAAYLVDAGIHANKAVGFVCNAKGLIWIPPGQQGMQEVTVLKQLATVTPGQMPLTDVLERFKDIKNDRASVVIITSCFNEEWVAELLRLSSQGFSPTVFLLDPASYGSDINAPAFQRLLTDDGITNYLVPGNAFSIPEAAPGGTHGQGGFQFRVTATGKSIALNDPSEIRWRKIV